VLVRWVAADGVEGWGECPTLSVPGYVTETTEQAWAALAGDLGAAVLGGDWLPTPAAGPPVAAGRTPAAAAALADAALDCDLRRAGRSLAAELSARTGLAARSAVPWCAVTADVSLSPGDAADRVEADLASGAAMVKVKVDGPDRGRAVLEAVLARVRGAGRPQGGGTAPGGWSGSGVPVAADANGSLGVAGVAALDDLGLAYLEQPLAPGATWADLAGLRASVATPIALDESLTSVADLRAALAAGCCDAVSLKPARMGGVAAAAAAAALCVDAGVACFVGGMFELGIGRASAAAVASLGGCTLPCDLGPSSRYLQRDICSEITCDAEGMLLVPDGPGIGREPYDAALAAATVERLVLS
jgi:O-succinylbenzoate synthase